jgi:hypothetical protein
VKSSIAVYKISSICGLILCISSINKISHSSIFDKILTKSDCFSIAGQLVDFKFPQTSFAIIFDKVVFQSPGGP